MKLTKLLTSAAVALGLATSAMADDKTKVGFVYVGPVGDGGWTYEHNKGRLAVEEHLATRSKPPLLKAYQKVPTPSV